MKAPEKLYEGNIRQKYFLFAIPLILTALLSQSYNFINSIMIGKLLGSEAFAATAVTNELLMFINSIFIGYLTGVGIYVSTLFGKNEYEKMLNVIKVNFLLTSSFSILIALTCNVFQKQIFEILNVNDEIYEDAEIYFRTYVLGYLFFQLNWGCIYIANGMGMSKIPLISSFLTGIINVLLNYIFLCVLQKGIQYSALATIASAFAATTCYIFIFVRLFKNMNLPLRGIRFLKNDLKQSIEYATPSMLQQMTMYACTAFVSPLTNTCTTAAISGYSVANKGRSLILAIYQESNKANTNFVAQTMGAGKIHKIKEGIRVGITQTLIIFGVCMALFAVFADKFSGLFLDPSKDAESLAVSVNIIRFLFPFIVFNVFNNLLHGIFRAVGSGKLLVISTLIYAISYVIYAYFLYAVLPYEMRIYSVHLALACAYITELIFAAIVYFTDKWKTPEYKRLETGCQ